MNSMDEFQQALSEAQKCLGDAGNDELCARIGFGEDASPYNLQRWREAKKKTRYAAKALRAVEQEYDETWWDEEDDVEEDDVRPRPRLENPEVVRGYS